VGRFKKIQIMASVEIPEVPSFLMMSDGQKIPLSAVSEIGLEEIGQEWTLALINKARKEQKNRQ
jgi:hypothetical protein